MARKLTKVNNQIILDIISFALKQTGIRDVSDDQSALLIRLICSGIANYFYNNPDDLIDLGFMRFKKNPKKEEVFAVELITDEKEGITNADTLYRYYKGDLNSEKQLKEMMEKFVNELLVYSQNQNNKIIYTTSKLQRKGGAKNGF